MPLRNWNSGVAAGAILLLLVAWNQAATAQPPQFGAGGPGGGPGAFGGPPRGFGPMNRPDARLVDLFDANEDGWLDLEERLTARAWLAAGREAAGGAGRRGFPGGGFGGPRRGRRGGNLPPATPGPARQPKDVPHYPEAELYDPSVMRTVFLDFESGDDWEAELEEFHGTDIEALATLTVDGTVYEQVGVHFRGMSSYMMVPRGRKRSLNVSLDEVDKTQRLGGYKTLNLLNCNGDRSLMSAVLYSHIARDYIPAPRANFVELVVNGKSWGVYANVQQFDKIFLKENYAVADGTRWKVPGSPGGDGGLRYLGESLDQYRARFEMKSNDGDEQWRALVQLCRILNETPPEQLEEKLRGVLDVDTVLKFLALDVALVNSDGYWTRASDYYLYRDSEGLFYLAPHDMNEAFHGSRRGGPGRGPNRPPSEQADPPSGPPGDDRPGLPPEFAQFGPGGGFPPRGGFGPPGRGGFGEGGVELDPLVGLDNQRMPLRSRLLAVPNLRRKYLGYVRQIAEDALDWDALGPFVESQRQLIDDAVAQETRGLASYDEFQAAVAELQQFANKRRAFLMETVAAAGDAE